jgi:hypothetical protein
MADELTRARAALQWCDSYSRMPTLIGLADVLSPDDWHTLLGEAWNICDNIGAHRNLLRRMLPPSGPVRQMMNADERAAYDALPERLTVYRGCGAANLRGASWSLRREVAARFPFLMRYRAERPLLVTASVLKRRVLAIKLDRDEAEIITFAARRTAVEMLRREATV